MSHSSSWRQNRRFSPLGNSRSIATRAAFPIVPVLVPGQTVGEYTLLARIGQGGMGTVFKARHSRLKRDVALKFLQPSLHSGTVFRRFEREGQTHARLNHPNLVRVFDHGHIEGLPYIAMELIDGPSVRGILEDGVPMPARQALMLMLPVLQALEYLHGRGVLHRDIKPANVLTTEGGQVKVADLGLCWEPHSTVLTETGGVVGTLPYLAPEMLAGDKPTAAVDIYASGVMLYQALSGQYPFAQVGRAELMMRVIEGNATPLSRVLPEVHPTVEAWVMRMLDKAPESRPTAEAVVRQLQQLLEEPISAAAPADQTCHLLAEPARPLVRRKGLHRWGIAFAGPVLVLALAMGKMAIQTPAPVAVPRAPVVELADQREAVRWVQAWMRNGMDRDGNLPHEAMAMAVGDPGPAVRGTPAYAAFMEELRKLLTQGGREGGASLSQLVHKLSFQPAPSALSRCFQMAWNFTNIPDEEFTRADRVDTICQRLVALRRSVPQGEVALRLPTGVFMKRVLDYMTSISFADRKRSPATGPDDVRLIDTWRPAVAMMRSVRLLVAEGLPLETHELTHMVGHAYFSLGRLPKAVLTADNFFSRFELGEVQMRMVQDRQIVQQWGEMVEQYLEIFLLVLADAREWNQAAAEGAVDEIAYLRTLSGQIGTILGRSTPDIGNPLSKAAQAFRQALEEGTKRPRGGVYRLALWFWMGPGGPLPLADGKAMEDLARQLALTQPAFLFLVTRHVLTGHSVIEDTVSWNADARRIRAARALKKTY
jgi:hypothetical protein